MRALRLLTGVIFALAVATSCSVAPTDRASCDLASNRSIMVLIAQSVPSATRVPCVTTLPAGWSYQRYSVRSGEASFILNSEVAGVGSVEVRLTAACDTGDAVEVPTTADESGLRRLEAPARITGGLAGARYYLFQGGCITYAYDFPAGAPPELISEADTALSFVARSEIAARTTEELGVELCGAGNPPCPGGT